MNMFEYIMHKDTYYGFEREVRAVAFAPAAGLADKRFYEDMFQLETEPNVRFCAPMVSLEQMIHGVVLHPDASTDFQLEVERLCTKCRLPNPQASRRNRKPIF